MTTVLIVDDQPLQRFGFRMLLESTPGHRGRRRDPPTVPRRSARRPNCAPTWSS